jgi:probable blue pigment (indigoidine) exporter
VARLEPGAVSMLGMMSPVTAVTLGWLWLGQHLSLVLFLGITIILCSIWAGQVRTGWAWQLLPGSSR